MMNFAAALGPTLLAASLGLPGSDKIDVRTGPQGLTCDEASRKLEEIIHRGMRKEDVPKALFATHASKPDDSGRRVHIEYRSRLLPGVLVEISYRRRGNAHQVDWWNVTPLDSRAPSRLIPVRSLNWE